MNRITDTNNTMPKAMKIFGLREPGSALTHMLAALLTFFAAFPLPKACRPLQAQSWQTHHF